ncbi:MAG TPA: hypothetical protein PKA41_09575 [Verrucomicrobiota bacterium]|nr:hypothetical protein [Verrucomicrobiota bacterium]
MEAQTPLGRIGKPHDIAGAALFLASPESSWRLWRDAGLLRRQSLIQN